MAAVATLRLLAVTGERRFKQAPDVPTQQMLRDNLKNVRLVQLPGTFHKVQLMYPAACATHLMHFAAQHDGIASREP